MEDMSALQIGLMVGGGLLGLIVAFTFLSWFYIVNGKQMAILETLGKPHTTAYGPGLHLKLPWPITSVVGKISTQIEQLEAPVQVKTKDNVFLTLPIKTQFRASDDPQRPVRAWYELNDPETQMEAYVLNIVRQTAASMNMADLYENRDKIEKAVTEELTARFESYGYHIEGVLVDQPVPPKEVADSFNRVIASQRLKEAAANEAEAARVKLVGTAQAESESKKLQGEGMANMRLAVAKGIEDSMKTMKAAGFTTEQAMDFLNRTNQLDTLSQVAATGNVMILDVGQGNFFGQQLGAIKAQNLQKKVK